MSYAFSENDLIFNGFNFKDLLKVEKVEMSLIPQIENTSQKIPGRAGAVFRKNNLGIREIIIYCRITKSNKQEIFDFRRRLSSLLYTEKPEILRFRNEKNLYYKAILDGDIKYSTSRKSAEVALKFVAHDPFGYSDIKTISGTGDRISFNYDASYNTSAIISLTLTSSAEIFLIQDLTSTKFIRIINNFSPGAKVKADCINNFIEINGEKSMRLLDYKSDFIKIKKGENRWAFSQSVNYEIAYQERWL